jgi:type III secretion system YscQ/HrcQ family protein
MKRIRPFPFDRLARLARGQVEAGRALGTHLPLAPGPAWTEAAAALGGPVELRLIEAYAFAQRELPERVGAGVLVRLVGPAHRGGVVVIDPGLAPRLARRTLGVESIEPGIPRALTAAEQGAIAFLVAALIDGAPLRVEGVVDRLDAVRHLLPDAWILALEARLETPVGAGWARLLVPDRLRLAAPLAHRPEVLLARSRRLSHARVSLRLEVGRTRVARRELASLGAGDVVLFDRFGPRPPFGGPTHLCLGAGRFRATLGGDGLTLLGPFEPGAPVMDDTDTLDPTAAPIDPASTDALLREMPVEVVCELGRVSMTGRELLELRPGAVIPVGRPLAGPVDLTVGGRVVARGELVDVEGEIGVRVTPVID